MIKHSVNIIGIVFICILKNFNQDIILFINVIRCGDLGSEPPLNFIDTNPNCGIMTKIKSTFDGTH